MNIAIFKLTFRKAINTPNAIDANMCMNQLMIEVNRPNEEIIKNIIKGCYNTIQRTGENVKKIRALMVYSRVNRSLIDLCLRRIWSSSCTSSSAGSTTTSSLSFIKCPAIT